MRIGEFSLKHGITQDAVRHYLDMGLLVAEKKYGQYKFVEADSRDLEKIIELKQMDFSLTEIQKILMIQRLSGANTDVFRNLYMSFLVEKKKAVEKEMEKYSKSNDFLNDIISKIKIEKLTTLQELGFPIAALDLLECPKCQRPLSVSEGKIAKNMIMDANIHCECEYQAVIENGVYIDKESVRKKMINGRAVPTKEEYLASASHDHVNFLYKGITSLIEFVNDFAKEPQYIMELDSCVGFFLQQYIKYLPTNSTYILIDYDLDRIVQLKKDLEMYCKHKKIIFLCCDFHRLPIRKESIDVIVDYGVTKVYAQETGGLLLDKALPLLKQDGIYTTSFTYFGPNSKGNFKLFENVLDFVNKEKMLEMLYKSNLEAIKMKHIGPNFEDNPYNTDLKGMELYQVAYAGWKRVVE